MNSVKLVGNSDVFISVLDKAKKVAKSSVRVLICGDTGTGKEEIAKYLHQNSSRCKKAFVAINCAALPSALMESELFGHVKGAFTTAHSSHDGLVYTANGGTLFLDEIAEMELSLQAKLLRFLETGEYRKVGATKNEYADVRIISATHQDLKERIAKNIFREDLYYRLSVLSLYMPMLNTRGDDILLLADYFLKRFSIKEEKEFLGLDLDAQDILKSYSWPGNIRELQNLIHKIVVLHEGGLVTAKMLTGAFGLSYIEGKGRIDNSNSEPNVQPRPLWQIEQEMIEHAIKYCDGNIMQAAALLEVSPSTIYRKLGNSGR